MICFNHNVPGSIPDSSLYLYLHYKIKAKCHRKKNYFIRTDWVQGNSVGAHHSYSVMTETTPVNKLTSNQRAPGSVAAQVTGG